MEPPLSGGVDPIVCGVPVVLRPVVVANVVVDDHVVDEFIDVVKSIEEFWFATVELPTNTPGLPGESAPDRDC